MPLFDPLRDFFQRRQIVRLDALSSDLQLVTVRSESVRGNFIFPGLSINVDVVRDGQRVGYIEYGLSPLKDRLYISDYKILDSHRRQGLGQAALWCLYRQHGLALATMHEVGTSLGFWSKIERRFAAAGVHLQRDIRTGEHDEIKASWAHLVPESEAERSIRKYWEWVAAEHAAGRPAGPGIR
ncbi:GNAT family N-acetyltransferase [Pseudomonas siliginis]|uniref:GNAT family N-acetyltransferase n=1 Tax=Pseudomonas siliginis TaxID=2842346 RepID=UPI002093A87C|nr:GNAT family N-acetyltransferase [Pseudomonas siliginis]UST77176.1 N-acetyltransferase [Pseudomonas siliginis]